MSKGDELSAADATPEGHRYTYGKGRRVRLQREAEALFKRGERSFAFPYRAVVHAYRSLDAMPRGCRLLAVAPKRVLKRAVDRNAAKRRMRELFRVESAPLHAASQKLGVTIDVAIIVVSAEPVQWQRAKRAMRRILKDAAHAAAKVS